MTDPWEGSMRHESVADNLSRLSKYPVSPPAAGVYQAGMAPTAIAIRFHDMTGGKRSHGTQDLADDSGYRRLARAGVSDKRHVQTDRHGRQSGVATLLLQTQKVGVAFDAPFDGVQTDQLVEDTVRDADALRANFLAEEFRKIGSNEQEASDRAQLIGAAWRGSQEMAGPQQRMRLIGLASATEDSQKP